MAANVPSPSESRYFPHGHTAWLVRCRCGREVICTTRTFTATQPTTHCGCRRLRPAADDQPVVLFSPTSTASQPMPGVQAPAAATNGGRPVAAPTSIPSNGKRNGQPVEYEVVGDGTQDRAPTSPERTTPAQQRLEHNGPVGLGRVNWKSLPIADDEPGRALMESDFFEDVSR